ncbi:MAG: hypothetical protein UY77_C0021G0006 [Candidatus Uhrbacteria bacterium GW2011_GWA2_53_10]|uniref:DNA-directed DNA polymerase n=1 Tax=Candidatus Uhrbacteria bacterium GW2011_GWA2_53_10 TaxID=1618980 RepID=A0A0G1ZVX7_9BACT|nr:MAG: hypothetical protein UY77_C0021G0006 [Candidatus Uhrbacteria bacterium GW2011_GWA2_53_10]HBF66874.1 DNA polymerase/3'-5' exonuclease PolX [Candidatus Magasanikbacteria bacterium]
MTNTEISQAFNDIANLLEIQGANRFRVRAYQNASLTIQAYPEEMSALHKNGGLKALDTIPGIGKDLAEKIEKMVTKNTCTYLDQLKKEIPAGLLDILNIEGMGPKRTKELWQAFKITNVEKLKELCKTGKLSKRKGWGPKSVNNILRSLALHDLHSDRLPIGHMKRTAEAMLEALTKTRLAKKIEIAGSYRRGKDTVGDLDFVASSLKPKELLEAFTQLPQMKKIKVKGETKCTARLDIGIDADIRVVRPEEYGAALYYSTGSRAHNVAVRKRTLKMGLTINEYGVFKGTKGHHGRVVAQKTEQDIFKALKLPYIPPELRENTGELEHLPKNLIELKHMQGDMHVHTTISSDAESSPLEMIRAARAKGFKYIAITDHATSHGIARGVTSASVDAYVREIKATARKVPGITVLVGSEVDIQPDGSLFLPDSALKKLDWVIASVHSAFRQSKKDMTKRVLHALSNPYVTVFGHPFARYVLARAPIELDFDAVLETTKRNKVLLEINASWHRLDLDDVHCRAASATGAMTVIDSDSHNADQFDLSFGVQQARRGWVEKNIVLNAQPLKTVQQWLKKKRTP